MKTKEVTLYTFDELSDRAKERAREWYRESSTSDFDDFGAESVLEDAARMADMLGISVSTRAVKLMGGGTKYKPEFYYSGFWSQGDGASFQGSYSYRPGSVAAIAKEAPAEGSKGNSELNRIARELADVQRRNFYQLQASISRNNNHYCHSMTMHVDVERADEKAVSDADAETVTQCMRDFADWLYRGLEAEYEYQNSDETVDGNIIANEYTFTEEGQRED